MSWGCGAWGNDRAGGGVLRRAAGSGAVAYEAGPTDFGLARALASRGIDWTVAAPGKIERPAQDRIKTDRRDAERLAGRQIPHQPVSVDP